MRTRTVACDDLSCRANARHPVKLPESSATGWKAWPRRLRRPRCSLDSARNDGYENAELISSDMPLVVQKYGGTSVGTPKRIQSVARRLVKTQREGCQVVA